MITFISGLPRNGKTLFAVDYLINKSRKENRPVYFHHIDMIMVPANWHKLENPADWWNLPTGSIIFFDEAHHLFPNRSSSQRVPAIVEKLNEHGHKGFDIFFISQLPKFLDPTARGLAQEHWHVVRKFGGNKANIHKYYGCVDNPQSKTRKSDSFEVQSYSYNKAIYGVYHSSDQHNVVKSVPLKYKMLFIIPVIIAILSLKVGLSWYDHLHKHKSDKPSQDKPSYLDTIKSKKTDNAPEGFIPVSRLEPISMVESFKPEIAEMPESAPVYHDLVKPTVYPKPVMCIASKSRCQCYTQQTTVYQTTEEFCRQIAKNGYFDLTPDHNNDQQIAQVNPVSSIPGQIKEPNNKHQDSINFDAHSFDTFIEPSPNNPSKS